MFMYSRFSFDSWGNQLAKDCYGNYINPLNPGYKSHHNRYADDSVCIKETRIPAESLDEFPHKYYPGDCVVVVYNKDDYSPEAVALDKNNVYSGMLSIIKKCIPVKSKYENPTYIISRSDGTDISITEDKLLKLSDIPDSTSSEEIQEMKVRQNLQDDISKNIKNTINDITVDIDSLKTDIDVLKTDLSTLTTVDVGTTPTVYRKDETDKAIYDSQQIVKEQLTGKIENDIALVKGDITKTNDTVVSTRKISKAALLGNILNLVL